MKNLNDFLNELDTETFAKKWKYEFYLADDCGCDGTMFSINNSGKKIELACHYLHGLNMLKQKKDVTPKEFLRLVYFYEGDSGNAMNIILGSNLYYLHAADLLLLNKRSCKLPGDISEVAYKLIQKYHGGVISIWDPAYSKNRFSPNYKAWKTATITKLE